jgi:LacI family transcriptional regulator
MMDLKGLAAHLDLSITTVSRALAGYSDVSDNTRARVKRAAEALGYRPNVAAQRLKTGRAGAVGLIFPQGTGGHGDPFFMSLAAGIGQALARHDLDLLLSTTNAVQDELRALERVIHGRRVDGIILPRTRWDDPRVDLLLKSNIPFVTHGRTARADKHAWLDIDGEDAFRQATERLIHLGHTRIALINAPQDYAYARHRHAGFFKAMTQAGLAMPDDYLREGPAIPETGQQETIKLLARPDPPTAILCVTDRVAYGCLAAVKSMNLMAGRDIAVIGYDDLPSSAFTEPPLTTMAQPIDEEGHRLVSILLDLISGASPRLHQELWQARLIIRQSDQPLN